MNVVGLLKFDISLTYQKFTGSLRMVWGPIGGSMDAKGLMIGSMYSAVGLARQMQKATPS